MILCHLKAAVLIQNPTAPRRGRKKPSMYMVTPYMEHDLAGLLENPSVILTEPTIKCYLRQLLHGINYLHQVS